MKVVLGVAWNRGCVKNGGMLHVFQRHPLPVRAEFEFSLVLAYALPAEMLLPLLPPGLTLDTYEEWGFLAIALVQTRRLRPTFLPQFVGQDFFLTGYRIFVRHEDPRTGRRLRGLRILRSDTNKRLMAFWGNRLTHYNYQVAGVAYSRTAEKLEVSITTAGGVADLTVSADLSSRPAALPEQSVFPDLKTARRYAGPLPFTFDYEKQTHSIVQIQGVRENWDPQPVRVRVENATFLKQFGGTARLSNAFYLENVPYLWKRGRRVRLEK